MSDNTETLKRLKNSDRVEREELFLKYHPTPTTVDTSVKFTFDDDVNEQVIEFAKHPVTRTTNFFNSLRTGSKIRIPVTKGATFRSCLKLLTLCGEILPGQFILDSDKWLYGNIVEEKILELCITDFVGMLECLYRINVDANLIGYILQKMFHSKNYLAEKEAFIPEFIKLFLEPKIVWAYWSKYGNMEHVPSLSPPTQDFIPLTHNAIKYNDYDVFNISILKGWFNTAQHQNPNWLIIRAYRPDRDISLKIEISTTPIKYTAPAATNYLDNAGRSVYLRIMVVYLKPCDTSSPKRLFHPTAETYFCPVILHQFYYMVGKTYTFPSRAAEKQDMGCCIFKFPEMLCDDDYSLRLLVKRVDFAEYQKGGGQVNFECSQCGSSVTHISV